MPFSLTLTETIFGAGPLFSFDFFKYKLNDVCSAAPQPTQLSSGSPTLRSTSPESPFASTIGTPPQPRCVFHDHIVSTLLTIGARARNAEDGLQDASLSTREAASRVQGSRDGARTEEAESTDAEAGADEHPWYRQWKWEWPSARPGYDPEPHDHTAFDAKKRSKHDLPL